MKAVRWIGERLFPLAVVVWLNGIALRITVRDSVELLAPLYYATPWPVIAALTLPMIWRVRRHPKMVFGFIMLAHVFFIMWILEDWRTGQPSRESADLRVAQWNVSRPERNLDAVIKRLRELDADIVAVAEAQPRLGETTDRWRAAFPEYSVNFLQGNMLSLVRGAGTLRESGRLGPHSYYSRLDVRVKEREFSLLQVDISGVPAQSRREPLARLVQLVDALGDRPLLVLGDFNTPRHSVHVDALRKKLVNTFEVAGLGSGETWPMPLPVLSLDQIWCSKELVPVRNRHVITFRSDHRAVVADLRFAVD